MRKTCGRRAEDTRKTYPDVVKIEPCMPEDENEDEDGDEDEDVDEEDMRKTCGRHAEDSRKTQWKRIE